MFDEKHDQAEESDRFLIDVDWKQSIIFFALPLFLEL